MVQKKVNQPLGWGTCEVDYLSSSAQPVRLPFLSPVPLVVADWMLQVQRTRPEIMSRGERDGLCNLPLRVKKPFSKPTSTVPTVQVLLDRIASHASGQTSSRQGNGTAGWVLLGKRAVDVGR